MGSIFVPLCGKSRDLLWLAQQGLQVVGVELSRAAIESFLAEQNLDAAVDRQGDFVRFRCSEQPITVYQGDFFNLPDSVLSECDMVFDRAALMALPADMRRAYAEKFKSDLRAGTVVLLVTLEHSSEINPPFCLQEADVRALYADAFSIRRIGEHAEEFRGKMATSILYQLTRQASATHQQRK